MGRTVYLGISVPFVPWIRGSNAKASVSQINFVDLDLDLDHYGGSMMVGRGLREREREVLRS